MTDRTTIDSSMLLPLEAPNFEESSGSDAKAPSLAPPAPAKPARRPRPTFDDGALTRIFKFPSKSYPRSSYYVTSTEIIIRIKKARKKWKLVVPKKRVVSYRTNRWFAKPRWIAIELTYTQAVKLGLAEARTHIPNTAPEIAGSEPAAPGQSEIGCADTTSASLSPVQHEAPEEGSATELQNDLTDQIDEFGEGDSADHFQLTADQDEFEGDEPLPQQSPLAPSQQETAWHHAAMQDDEPNAHIVPFAASRQRIAVAPRWTSRHAVATLAVAIAGLCVWAAFDSASVNHSSTCAPTEPAARCASPIVTGSIDPPGAPPLLATPPSVAQIEAVARAEIAAQDIAEAASPAAVDETPDAAFRTTTTDDASVVDPAGRDIAQPPSNPIVASAAPTPQQIAAEPAECDSLSAVGRQIQINFDYARARLDSTVIAMLEDFAAMLLACPASNVTIEGHSDSDGHADRNRALSLQRAQAVQKELIAAGVDPRRLATIGFGQTRPKVPNHSEKNKRNNRRAELVVTAQLP